ncbi:sulfatase-like hydrolase/transferase [Ciceribacter sp. L1K22]|uniref:sulfatase-like hydrolase/transferase n=1 Tax=Ciceribacter sp. L1K22 TaxID=2820275 RepID=UPI001ABD9DD2|nr:sulfatase-like hydrolase/transferase [Ciceribacter sp. L1K22]MBO3761784.1 sulfatase [Ciceribacter sp. L1K22]
MRRQRAFLACVVFIVIGFFACVMPDYPQGVRFDAFIRFPLEVPLVALALLLAPRRLAQVLAVLATIAVFCLLFLKIADIGVLSAFQRRFNPYLDIKMMADGWNLLSGSVGRPGALAVVGLVAFGIGLLLWAFWWASTMLGRFHGGLRTVSIVAFGVITGLGVALIAAGPRAGAANIAELRQVGYLGDRLSLVARSVEDIRVFETSLATGVGRSDAADLFGSIEGRDVVLVFIESYGRSAIDDARYGTLIRPRLDAIGRQLEAAGFASASGWALSPTVGGLSWLAHGTLLSGLWVDSQARYDLLMRSDRPSLNRLFRDAGWHTVAVMPAITMDWPEAAYYGYDEVLAAKDLGYRGKPFNWVTMPDQFTLSAFERLARRPGEENRKPVMAEIALISSHAPWTPVPRLIDWSQVGDGTVFNQQAESGDSPPVVWSDHERVRRQYVETIDYALETLGDYIARFGKDAVFIVLGDHQPASLVTGPDASRAVPVHVISRDADLVKRFLPEGFSPGMIPQAHATEGSMDRLRERLIRNFSAPPAP